MNKSYIDHTLLMLNYAKRSKLFDAYKYTLDSAAHIIELERWHDLQKDPRDLPKFSYFYLCELSDGGFDVLEYSTSCGCWLKHDDSDGKGYMQFNVIKWKRINEEVEDDD